MDSLTAESRRLAWKCGVVASWYLRDDQVPVYKHLFKHKNPFIEASRRYGKTTTILAYVLEMLRANPGWVARWCEPNKNQAREIVLPELDKIQAHCPKDIRFQWQVTDSVAVGPGNSRLYLRGVNEDRGDSSRGSFANIIVQDEYGSWRDPEYITNEVLRPQLLTTSGQLITASTPPKELDHPYYAQKGLALRDNRFIQRVITDNRGLTPEQIEDFIEEMGGLGAPAVRRELFCEPVSDPDALVVPEFNESLHVIDDDVRRPEFCDKYVGCDLGFQDWNAFLFGYYDFGTQTLVIEDEWVANGKNTSEIAIEALKKEKTLWEDEKPFRRVADNELQQLHDLATLHGYLLTPTRKDDKLAAISDLRVRFSQGKVKIKRRCKALSYQLKVGIWDDRRKGFVRGDSIGHLDAIDALIYLHRNLSPAHNPYPPFLGARLETHHIPLTPSPGRTKEVDALKGAFRPFGTSGGSQSGFK